MLSFKLNQNKLTKSILSIANCPVKRIVKQALASVI